MPVKNVIFSHHMNGWLSHTGLSVFNVALYISQKFDDKMKQ